MTLQALPQSLRRTEHPPRFHSDRAAVLLVPGLLFQVWDRGAAVLGSWQELCHEIERSPQTIDAIDTRRERWVRSAFVGSIAGKFEWLRQAGDFVLVQVALDLVRAYNERHWKLVITARHGFWKLAELARQKAQDAEALTAEEPTVVDESAGIRIVSNPQADRVQVVFANKPSEHVRAALRGEAWSLVACDRSLAGEAHATGDCQRPPHHLPW